MSSMADILRAMDAADKPVAECPPEMGQMDQGGSINIQMNDAGQMAQLLQALQSVQQGGQGEADVDEGSMKDQMMNDAENMDKEDFCEKYMAMGMDKAECEEHWNSMNEDYANEPEEEYMGIDSVLPSGDDLHKTKKSYPATAGGDNPMNVESIKDRLYAALNEKKGKPDFLDLDKDGDKKEPMKKAAKDAGKGKGSKPKKGQVPPQFQKEAMEEKKEKCPECGKKGKVKLMACASCGCK